MQLAAGVQLDRYMVVAPLGRGGMAVVYLVRHERLGTWHALKVLHGGSASLRERLLREGRVQGALRHGNVLAVTDVIDVGGAPGLVMDYISGPTLAALLGAGPLTLDQADALARPILDAVVAAHRAGLVHRDLKPENVLLAIEDERLVPKVADFGLAKILDGSDAGPMATRSGMPMGTPAYMAPEQIRDASRVDARADVFALGCILYELVTGRTAFEGGDSYEVFQAVVEGRFTPPREAAPHLDADRAAAIEAALAGDLDQRLPSAAALRDAWVGGRSLAPADPALLDRARSLARPPAEVSIVVASRSSDTWTDSVAPAPVLAPPSAASPPPARRWIPAVGLAALVVVATAVAWFGPGEATVEAHVLGSRSVVQVVEDPVAQQQFAEAWRAYLDCDFRTAERKAEFVVAQDPADPLPWILLAEARFGTGNDGAAADAIWTAVQRSRTFDTPAAEILDLARRVAIEEAWEGEVATAWHAYLARYPGDYQAGLFILDGSRHVPADDIRAIFDIVVERDPEPAIPYYLFANDRLRRGLWDEAEAVATAGLVRAPGSPALLQRLGRARLHRGAFAEAGDTLERASQADPGLLSARVDLAILALMTGDEGAFARLQDQILGPTTALDDQVVFAIEVSDALAGLGRAAAAEALVLDVAERARATNAWEAVGLLYLRLDDHYTSIGDFVAAEAHVARRREMLQAPELAAEHRQRLAEISASFEARLAAQVGDLERARMARERMAALPRGNPRLLAGIDHELAVASRSPDDLRPDLFEEGCARRVVFGLDALRAGAPGASEGLRDALADEPRCSAVGWPRLARATALVALAERWLETDPEAARQALRDAAALLPAADPDLPVALRWAELERTLAAR